MAESPTLEDYAAGWALLLALEKGDNDTANLIADTYDAFALQQSMALVATVLLAQLRNHAEDDCGAGTVAWLEERVLMEASRIR